MHKDKRVQLGLRSGRKKYFTSTLHGSYMDIGQWALRKGLLDIPSQNVMYDFAHLFAAQQKGILFNRHFSRHVTKHFCFCGQQKKK